jgi:putative hydrolase of HD superfamily
MYKLENVLRFVNLLNKYRTVKREILVNSEDRLENDIEHSYQLAMLGWYLADSEKLSLDKNLLVKYALVHDLVEVYAGDTFAFADEDLKRGKIEKEREAIEQLKQEFPEFKELHELIHNYEERTDSESNFIYALDKLQPTLNIYTDGGRSWRRDGVTLQMIIDYKNDKISEIPELKKYFDELILLLKQKNKELFN